MSQRVVPGAPANDSLALRQRVPRLTRQVAGTSHSFLSSAAFFVIRPLVVRPCALTESNTFTREVDTPFSHAFRRRLPDMPSGHAFSRVI